MPETKSEIIKNLEKQLLRNGKAACPNPECKQAITTEESQGRAGSNILEYWCQNETCDYHKKRVINISIGKGWLEEIKGAFSNLGKKAIAGVVGFLILFATSVGSNVKSFFFGEEEKEKGAEMLERKIDSLEAVISRVPENNDPVASNSKEKDQKILLLENRLDSLQAILDAQPLRSSALRGMIDDVVDYMKAEDVSNAKKVFDNIYSNQKLKNSFLAPENNQLKKKMVERIADSYSPTLNRFTYEYLKTEPSFEFFQNFLDTFSVPAKNIYLGKAFYNYPHYTDKQISFKESKILQLTGVKHYLLAARDGRFSISDNHIISAINNVLGLYKLFKYKFQENEIPEDYVTVETAIESRNVLVIKQRIDELQSILNNLSERNK